jgi:hypothetical protein
MGLRGSSTPAAHLVDLCLGIQMAMELLAFKLPNGAEFKLPADWWNEAGMYTVDRESPFSMRIKICPSFSFAWGH